MIIDLTADAFMFLLLCVDIVFHVNRYLGDTIDLHAGGVDLVRYTFYCYSLNRCTDAVSLAKLSYEQ
jgi:hypothetical protein